MKSSMAASASWPGAMALACGCSPAMVTISRRGFRLLPGALAALPGRSFLIDSEAIVTNEDGLAVFDLIRRARNGGAAVLCAFDLIEFDGEDLRRAPIEHRKHKLARLVRTPRPGIVINEHYDGDGDIVFKYACKLGCEGIVSKRLGSTYRSGRFAHWVKVKNPKRQRSNEKPKKIGDIDIYATNRREAMANITILSFDKDGMLEGPLPVPETTHVVLIAHGWNEIREDACDHYQHLVDPLEAILSQNAAQWQGHTVAYFGVIWPAAKYADDLTVINMQADIRGAPDAGITSPPLNDADLKAHARDVALFLGINNPDQLAPQALQAASDEGARDDLVSMLQSATAARRQLADEQTKAEHDDTFSDNTGSKVFLAIDRELQRLSTNADAIENPLRGSLKHPRRDAKSIIAYILNLFAYNEMKIRAGVVGRGLAEHVLDPWVAASKRVHLVGHSFGGRLMTAATDAVEGKISNLTALEGAFSHNALSIDPDRPMNGAFKSVIDNTKLTGRIVAAHSKNDRAVWILYPLASRIFHDTYSLRPAGPLDRVFGGPTDRYGAMGANGPQNLTDVNHLIFTGTSLPRLKPGVHALDCTSFVACHSDVSSCLIKSFDCANTGAGMNAASPAMTTLRA